MTASECRRRARISLGGNIFGSQWVNALALFVVYSFVMVLANSISSGVCGIVIMGAMNIGLSSTFLAGSRSDTSVDIEYMFTEGFTKDFVRAFLIGFLKAFFIVLWSLLFIIPGIIKKYSYALAEYVAADHPEYDWKQCIDESRRLMDGNKWRLFCLDFSFIGWVFVSIMFTCGIASLWIKPYQRMALTEFYRDLVENRLNEVKY